ncbi:hypothetical protein NHH03_04195 [Stieleria sp. TO1_6]|uniref:hypothetical protein n=1 Tax=Stieleria tagensis TaxID=2956795 RepID=UPI00209A9D14|nr:hypothetical protein [Stieleria tagensis]MCO8120927.1 hypothetical protein [Stieleria tagensis]
MIQPSTWHFKTRRLVALTFTLVVIAAFWAMNRWQSDRLGSPAYFTGFTALSCLMLLMLLGVRRRLPFWRLGSVSMWTQIHLYVGLFTTAIYLMHVPALIASGLFESFLSMLFLMVTASGFYGLYASRTLPRKLTQVETQHRFDQTESGRHQIATAAQQTHGRLADSAAQQVLDAFYQQVLAPFFISRPSLSYVIAPSGYRRRRLLGDLKELDRYLETEGRQYAGQFAALVRRRDDLDYQYALQLRLRCWVVFHSLLSVVLIVASIIHAIIVLRFMG